MSPMKPQHLEPETVSSNKAQAGGTVHQMLIKKREAKLQRRAERMAKAA